MEKRWRAAAVQDAVARNETPGEREVSWSAPVLWRFWACVAGELGKGFQQCRMMEDKLRQNASQNFKVMGVTDCLLSELANTGLG